MLHYYERWLYLAVSCTKVEEAFNAARQSVLALDQAPDWFNWPDGTELPEGPPAERLAAIKSLLDADLCLARKALDPKENPVDALRLIQDGNAVLVVLEQEPHEAENPLYIALERLTGAGIFKRERSIYGQEKCAWINPNPQRVFFKSIQQNHGGEDDEPHHE